MVVDDSDARPEIFLAYDKSRDASMSEKITVDSLAWLFENSIDVLLLYFGNFVIIHNSLFVLSYALDKKGSMLILKIDAQSVETVR